MLCQTDSISESQVNSKPHLKVLPNQIIRGIPKVNYEPVLNSKTRYHMSNFVSYHRLSKESEAFENQLFLVFIPSSM